MLYTVVFGLHAYALSAAIFLLVANEGLLIAARRGRQAPARIAFFAIRLAGLLVSVGVLAGLALLYVGGWSLLTPWLLLSFALIGALMAIDRKVVRPWTTRAQAALRGAVPAREIELLAGDKRALAGRMAMIALFALVVVLMVAKPELTLFA